MYYTGNVMSMQPIRIRNTYLARHQKVLTIDDDIQLYMYMK